MEVAGAAFQDHQLMYAPHNAAHNRLLISATVYTYFINKNIETSFGTFGLQSPQMVGFVRHTKRGSKFTVHSILWN